MPAKQHAIPQNIMDVEFKLVGDLTLRQFIYVAAGLAIAYISFVSDVASPIKWLIIFLFGGGGLDLAKERDCWRFHRGDHRGKTSNKGNKRGKSTTQTPASSALGEGKRRTRSPFEQRKRIFKKLEIRNHCPD